MISLFFQSKNMNQFYMRIFGWIMPFDQKKACYQRHVGKLFRHEIHGNCIFDCRIQKCSFSSSIMHPFPRKLNIPWKNHFLHRIKLASVLKWRLTILSIWYFWWAWFSTNKMVCAIKSTDSFSWMKCSSSNRMVCQCLRQHFSYSVLGFFLLLGYIVSISHLRLCCFPVSCTRPVSPFLLHFQYCYGILQPRNVPLFFYVLQNSKRTTTCIPSIQAGLDPALTYVFYYFRSFFNFFYWLDDDRHTWFSF